MSSHEQRNHSKQEAINEDLLAELEALNKAIEPYLETALSIDELQRYEHLLEQKDWVTNELQEKK